MAQAAVTNFHTREIPRSGSKAKNGEKKTERERKKKEKKEERKLVITMASYAYALQTPSRVADIKPPEPIHIANATLCGTRKATWANLHERATSGVRPVIFIL